MGKLLPVPYPGQSMGEYREQLINFQKNYWSFLKPSKGGSKFIPLPPLTLINKTKEMQSRKLSEHVEDELFNKEKRVTVDPEKVIKPTPKIKKDSKDFLSEESKTNIVKTITNSGEYSAPVKKKKPYYRKKYNKPTPVEVTPEPVKQHRFALGVLTGIILSAIIETIIQLLK
jgi:hypothetical protein